MNLCVFVQLQLFAEKHEKASGDNKVSPWPFVFPPFLHKAHQPMQAGASSSATPGASTSTSTPAIVMPQTTAQSQSPATPTATPQHPAVQAAMQQVTGAAYAAMKPGDAQSKLIGDVNPGASYPPIRSSLDYTVNPGPVQWTPTRPTLTGGLAAGRISSTSRRVRPLHIGCASQEP